MKEIKVTNLIKFYTLLLLYEKPKYGYEIMREIGEKLGKEVSAGQMYPFLSKLEKQKYIKIKKLGKREKKTYLLTRKGRLFVKKMLERFGGLIDIAIEPKITVCVHCGCKVYEGGYKKKIRKRTLKFCCHHCAKAYR